MVTRHVIIAAWLLCPMAAYGQTQVLLINQTLLDNQRFYGPGSFTRTAISLSAGQALLGLGAGTTAIHSDATVTTGNFIASPSAGSTLISGLRIESPDVTTEAIQGDATEQAAFNADQFQEIGVALDATEVGRLVDCEIEGFRNYGAVLVGTGTHRKLSIDFCKFFGNWHGFKLETDSSATGNLVATALDRGIDVNGSGVQLAQNHAYGMKYALHVAPTTSLGGLMSTNDRFEDSNYGIYLSSNYNVAHFVNVKLYHNFQRGALIEGTVVRFISPMVDVAHSSPSGPLWPDKVGIEFVGASNEITSGLINLENFTQSGHGTPTASTAIRIRGNNCRVDTTIYDQDGLNGSRGLNIPARLAYGFTANAATDTFTAAGHALANNDPVQVSNTGGALPTGLSVGTNYYVVGVAANTYQLSATQGGAPINITDAGTGTHTVGAGIRGGEFTYRIYGFEGMVGAQDAALDIDEASLTGVTVTIIGNSMRSPGFDHTDVNQYIDIPSGWDNSGANANVFYIKDEATGKTTTVSDGLAH